MIQTPARVSGVYVTLAIGAAAPVLLWLAGWSPSAGSIELAGLMLATILNGALHPELACVGGAGHASPQQNRRILEHRPALEPPTQASGRVGRHRSTATSASMPLSFVIDFAALLLVGGGGATVVATLGVILRTLADSRRHQVAAHIATVVAATQGAALVHLALGGTVGHFVWPWQGVPIGAAVLVYCAIKYGSLEIVVPLLAQQPIDRTRLLNVVRDIPDYILGAGVAVAVAEAIDHRLWGALLVASIPLFFVYRSYRRYIDHREREQRLRELIESLDQGMCVLDHEGRIVLWNDALQQILGYPGDHVLGRSLAAAAPALAKTSFPQALDEAVAHGAPRMLSHFTLPTPLGVRVLQVRILPEAAGITVLWHDLTEQSRAEVALQRSEERFTLLEAGANDGLWEWDVQGQRIHFSARWRAMVGLPPESGMGRPGDWLGRVHPEDVDSLRQAIDAHLSGKTEQLQHEHRIRHENGLYRRFLCRGVAARGARGRRARLAGSLTDVTDRVNAQERLRSLGFRDPLTGLWNRTVFVEGLGRRLDEFKQNRSRRFAALYLDLDRFKVVNDSLGHLIGDQLLTAVSRRLEKCLREGDALARLGGDEFAILLNGLESDGQANAIAFRIQEALSTPFSIGGREVFTSASIGIAFSAPQYNHPEEIMRDADTAMYHAKAGGKARHEMFDAEMHARALDRLGLENDLRHAVKSRAFQVHYQPIVSLTSGMCAGFEALVRWNRNGEPISPEKFIPVAEELGLIEQLGTWVLREACRTFAGWRRQFPDYGLECITVNVSTRQLIEPNFLRIVEDAVHQAGLRPSDLRIEITETTLMGSPHVAAEALHDLRNFGVKVYLDDFGTGYSSLSHLHKLPVDALKIDRSFVRSLLLPERPAIVESILALARTLKTGVVAEGVESDVQAQELRRLGCRHAQGYFFSPPLSSERVEEMLASRQPPRWKGSGSLTAAGQEAAPFLSSKHLEWPDGTQTTRVH